MTKADEELRARAEISLRFICPKCGRQLTQKGGKEDITDQDSYYRFKPCRCGLVIPPGVYGVEDTKTAYMRPA